MSSKRAQRWKACESKIAYATREAARRRCFDRMGVYECGFCGAFHVGHVPKRVRQSRRAIAAAHRS
jgi:hypothetical protein